MATLTETINQASAEALPMVGTKAQIQWAETLADTRTTEILDALRVMYAGIQTSLCSKEDFTKALRRGCTIIKINRAAWWIEHRTQNVMYLLIDEFESNLK